MISCDDKQPLLHALIDGELDASNSIALEAHLRDCAECRAELDRIEALRRRIASHEIAFRAPPELRRRVEEALDAVAPETVGSGTSSQLPVALGQSTQQRGTFARFAAGLLVGGLTGAGLMAVLSTGDGSPSLRNQFIASHVRSLQPGHLTDVTTSDRHLVKPWFNGRIDIAPPVPELAKQGFPLIGGRLDYVAGRTAAAVVYGRRLHRINLFVLSGGAEDRAVTAAKHEGYNIVHWSTGGLDYWAVSDLNAKELVEFQRLFTATP